MHTISCSHRRCRHRAPGLLALLCAALSPVAAAGVSVHVSGAYDFPESTAFDLHLVREDLEADYDDSAGVETLRLRRIGISIYEALGESARGGIRLGYAGVRQSGRPATAGFDPAGSFAELDFAGAWPAGSRLQAALAASWRYTRVDDSDATTEVELDWETLELRPALRFAWTPRVGLTLGASATAIDGSERVRAATRTTTDFSAADAGGGFLALDYHPAPADTIRLRLRGGNPQGLSITFEHRY